MNHIYSNLTEGIMVSRLVMCVMLIGMSLGSGGCGVYMAFTQPPKVDSAELNQGAFPRSMVVERLGPPKGVTKKPDGGTTEIFEFYEGSDPGWKMARGTFHLLADFFTVALWEIVATPMEFAVRGDKLTGQAEFDSNERLVSFRILGREIKPLEKIHKQQNGTAS
jgi:hypothetical protein